MSSPPKSCTYPPQEITSKRTSIQTLNNKTPLQILHPADNPITQHTLFHSTHITSPTALPDTKLDLLKYYLATLEYPPNITPNIRRFIATQSKRYFIYNERLYRRGNPPRLVINSDTAKEVILQMHTHPFGGHFALQTTKDRIARRYYWIGMENDIRRMLAECDRCQRLGKRLLNEKLRPIPVPLEPFHQVGIDIKHLSPSRAGYQYIIVGICYLTKYVEAQPLRHMNAFEVSRFIYEDIICRHGCPTILISDQGRPIKNKLVQTVCAQYSIEHRFSSPYMPTTNGLVERFNRTLGTMLNKLNPAEQDDWHAYVPSALFA